MKLSIVLFAFLMTIRCGSGTPVEFANVCDKANNEKRVQVVGYLDNNGSAMCSSGYGKPMHCPVKFKADLSSETSISADIDKGKGSSEIDVYEEGKGLKIKDDKGEIIERTQKVKIIADVRVYDTPEPTTMGCYVMVNTIEKQ
ncbi:MAG: hypothetical protein IPI64_13545 [Chloracidobacterium sp.]|nr:hypothetical protein [Chloracidobacterium sp.]